MKKFLLLLVLVATTSVASLAQLTSHNVNPEGYISCDQLIVHHKVTNYPYSNGYGYTYVTLVFDITVVDGYIEDMTFNHAFVENDIPPTQYFSWTTFSGWGYSDGTNVSYEVSGGLCYSNCTSRGLEPTPTFGICVPYTLTGTGPAYTGQ